MDYAVIDVETTRIQHGKIPETKFWGYADADRYERFKTSGELAKFLRKQPAKILLHHSNFDVIQLLVDGIKGITILKSHNARLIKCAWGNHYLLNSYSVFPVALRSIFKAFGFEKTSLSNLAKRNYEDCVNGLSCMLQLDELFFKLVGVSALSKGTIAATGFAAAENAAGRMPKDLRFLEAYRGGRVEVFDTRWTDRVSNFDISSSYPKSILDCPRKTELLRVKVTTRDWHGPLFDANNREMLLFPNGTFTSYIFRDVWERYVEPHCSKTNLRIISRHKIDLEWLCELKGLVNDIYDKKASSGGGVRLCCKLLLNSLYGRMGLKGESERARILPYIPDGDGISVNFLRRGQYLVFDTVLREPRSNFGFAAYITDNARGRLFAAFVRNGALYGDTDSIYSPAGPRTFSERQGDKIGDWNYGGQSWFKAHNVKDYEHGCYACRHSKSRKCDSCNGSKTIFVRKGGEDFTVWTLKQFAHNKTANRVHRTRQSGLRKRAVLPDGRTEPLTVKT